jgi:hypothetical protein
MVYSILTKILESGSKKLNSTVAAVLQKDDVLILKFYFIFYFSGCSLGTVTTYQIPCNPNFRNKTWKVVI